MISLRLKNEAKVEQMLMSSVPRAAALLPVEQAVYLAEQCKGMPDSMFADLSMHSKRAPLMQRCRLDKL